MPARCLPLLWHIPAGEVAALAAAAECMAVVVLAVEAASMEVAPGDRVEASTEAPAAGFMAVPVLEAVADLAAVLVGLVSTVGRALVAVPFMVAPVGAAGRAVVFIAVAAAGAVEAGGAGPAGVAGVTPAMGGAIPVMAMVSGAALIGAVAGAGVRPLPLARC